MAIDLHRCAVAGDPDDLLLTRVYSAPPRPSRTPFQRDRERIVQARAFRRLAGKTQVFTSRASDHFRSRLTHTIEVAQIARTVAATLGLNEDLAETLLWFTTSALHRLDMRVSVHWTAASAVMGGVSTTTCMRCASSSISSSVTPHIAG
jgi:hypothetical protein